MAKGHAIAAAYLSTSEAAEALGYTTQHTRLLIRLGRLRGIKIGRDWLIEKTSITEYHERGDADADGTR